MRLKGLSPSTIQNIQFMMQTNTNPRAREIWEKFEDAFLRFLSRVPVPKEVLGPIAGYGDELNFITVFRNGFLSPNGMFFSIHFAMHEYTVQEVTKYQDLDTACENGWLKFTLGLPYNHNGECIFLGDADTSKITQMQRAWLNQWLTEITGNQVNEF